MRAKGSFSQAVSICNELTKVKSRQVGTWSGNQALTRCAFIRSGKTPEAAFWLGIASELPVIETQSRDESTSTINRESPVMRERLLVSQRHHGIDARGAPRGNEAGPKANRGENNNSEHERQRIVRLEPKEQRSGRFGGSKRACANDNANRNQHRHLSEDQPNYAGALAILAETSPPASDFWLV